MSRAFLPAAGLDILLPLYDPLWWVLGGAKLRADFIRDAGIARGQRILDVGCGTGSLLVQIAQTAPEVRLSGIDPDAKALARCRRKSASAGVEVEWCQGFADELPHADGSFDRVLSSFMFHHLDLDTRRGMLREAHRVLIPGGELHLVDFAGQQHGHGPLAHWFHRHEQPADHRGGRVVELFVEAGFDPVREVSQHRSILGSYAHVRGVR